MVVHPPPFLAHCDTFRVMSLKDWFPDSLRQMSAEARESGMVGPCDKAELSWDQVHHCWEPLWIHYFGFVRFSFHKPCVVYTDPLDQEVLEDGPWYADLFAQGRATLGAEQVMKIVQSQRGRSRVQQPRSREWRLQQQQQK